MPNLREKAAADHYRTTIGGGCFPFHLIIPQAPLQYTQVERSIVSDKDTGSHKRFDLLPQLGKGWSISHHILINPGKPGVEIIKVCLRIHIREERIGDLVIFDDGNPDRAHAVIEMIWCFHVKDDVFHLQYLPSSGMHFTSSSIGIVTKISLSYRNLVRLSFYASLVSTFF